MAEDIQAAVDLLSQFVSDICANPTAAKYDEDGLCKSCGNLVGSHAIATVLAALAQAQQENERLKLGQGDYPREAVRAAATAQCERDVQGLSDPVLLEAVAAWSHRSWAKWTAYMLEKLKPQHIARWRRQIATEYVDLTEPEKESDRVEAREVLAIIAAAIRAHSEG